MLCDYDLGAEAKVTMVARWCMEGCYRCWVPVDESNPHHIVDANFALEITGDSISINGITGRACWDDQECTVQLSKAVTLRPDDGLYDEQRLQRQQRQQRQIVVKSCRFTFQGNDGKCPHAWPISGEFYGVEPANPGLINRCGIAKFRGKP